MSALWNLMFKKYFIASRNHRTLNLYDTYIAFLVVVRFNNLSRASALHIQFIHLCCVWYSYASTRFNVFVCINIKSRVRDTFSAHILYTRFRLYTAAHTMWSLVATAPNKKKKILCALFDYTMLSIHKRTYVCVYMCVL